MSVSWRREVCFKHGWVDIDISGSAEVKDIYAFLASHMYIALKPIYRFCWRRPTDPLTSPPEPPSQATRTCCAGFEYDKRKT